MKKLLFLASFLAVGALLSQPSSAENGKKKIDSTAIYKAKQEKMKKEGQEALKKHMDSRKPNFKIPAKKHHVPPAS
jgi:hypothetical protein